MTANLSILVPCYNVEKYVRQCLESIRKQTFTEFEVWMINDGSTDDTLSILREFEQTDSRFKLIDKKNSGYGASLNLGLKQCTGEYIGIVESDDFVENNMFDLLYKAAKKFDLDKCRCGYFDFYSGENFPVLSEFVPKNEVFVPRANLAPLYMPPSIWASIYKRSWLLNEGIKFLETPGASFQDTSFSYKTYVCCNRFMMIDKALLHYRQDSGTNSVSNRGKVFCICDEFSEIYRYLDQHPEWCTKDLLAATAVIKFNSYDWNFRRIAPEYKISFLNKWFFENWSSFLHGKLPFSNMNRSNMIKQLILLLVPWAYYLYRSYPKIFVSLRNLLLK